MRKAVDAYVYKHRKILAKLTLAILSLALLVLLVLPANYFDNGKPMCISVLLLNKQCYGCGMTRGIQHLLHLDFEGAWSFNKLSFFILPAAVGLIAKELLKIIFEKDSPQN